MANELDSVLFTRVAPRARYVLYYLQQPKQFSSPLQMPGMIRSTWLPCGLLADPQVSVLRGVIFGGVIRLAAGRDMSLEILTSAGSKRPIELRGEVVHDS